MEEKSDTLLTLNSFTLLISLTLLVGILAILLITFSTGLGMLFGMLLALVYPVLLLLALCGFGLYVVLLVLNIKATVRWIRKKTSARRPKLTLLVFSGSTVILILIAVVSGLISAPLIIIEARQFSVSNPFLTRPVRIVPVYPIGRMDDQSKFDEIGQRFFDPIMLQTGMPMTLFPGTKMCLLNHHGHWLKRIATKKMIRSLAKWYIIALW